MKGAACFKCKFWARESQVQGQCRVDAPQGVGIVMVQGVAGSQPLMLFGHPTTTQDVWCGKFEHEVELMS